jgi:hypothetical protein
VKDALGPDHSKISGFAIKMNVSLRMVGFNSGLKQSKRVPKPSVRSERNVKRTTQSMFKKSFLYKIQ